MNNQKIIRFLFILVPVLLVLSIWWNAFAPFLSIALVYLILLVIRSGFVNTLFAKLREPTVYYQPPQQPPPSSKPEPPRANPPLGFDLSPQEYQQLSKHYQQGYQPQAPQQPPKTRGSAMPKQDRTIDYEQPQAHYPEQTPPMA